MFSGWWRGKIETWQGLRWETKNVILFQRIIELKWTSENGEKDFLCRVELMSVSRPIRMFNANEIIHCHFFLFSYLRYAAINSISISRGNRHNEISNKAKLQLLDKLGWCCERNQLTHNVRRLKQENISLLFSSSRFSWSLYLEKWGREIRVTCFPI